MKQQDLLTSVSLDNVKNILVSASKIIKRLYEEDITVTYKRDGSPLTAADKETNGFLEGELSRLFPGAGWLSEESADDLSRLDCDWVWIVDPLDGSKEFVRRIPELAISVGLVYLGNVMLGGIVNPVTNEGGVGLVGRESLFWGMAGSKSEVGVTLANATASVSRTEIEDGSVAPYLKLVGTTCPVGSVAYKLLRVAAGVENLTFSVQSKSEWDICGGVALMGATGKVYARLDGNPLLFNQVRPRITSGAVAGDECLVSEFLRKYSEVQSRKGRDEA